MLWRLDHAPAGRVDLFISSPRRPDLTHLVEQAGWPSLDENGWSTFAYGEFLDALREGDVWAFRLTANPVHHIRRDVDAPGAPTKRAAHVTPRHQIGWLLKRQEHAGFAIVRRHAEDGHAEDDHAAPGTDHEVIVHDRTPMRFDKPLDTEASTARPGRDRSGRSPATQACASPVRRSTADCGSPISRRSAAR